MKEKNKNHFKNSVANELACHNLMDIFGRYIAQRSDIHISVHRLHIAYIVSSMIYVFSCSSYFYLLFYFDRRVQRCCQMEATQTMGLQHSRGALSLENP